MADFDESDGDYPDDDSDPGIESTPCGDCGAEYDHEPWCVTAAELLMANDEEAERTDLAYARAVRPLVEQLIAVQGQGTVAEMRVLGKLFAAHNKHGGERG